MQKYPTPLARIRAERGLSLAQLAQASADAGFKRTRMQWSNYEKGVHPLCREQVEALTKALELGTGDARELYEQANLIVVLAPSGEAA